MRQLSSIKVCQNVLNLDNIQIFVVVHGADADERVLFKRSYDVILPES